MRRGYGSDFTPGVLHECHTSDMQHTGGEVRLKSVPAQGDAPSAQRVLLTLGIRDYASDDNTQQFAAGIDQQLRVVGEWWQTPGAEQPFRQVGPPEELRNRDQVEDFLRQQKVRELRAEALVVFITGHGIGGRADTHFLRMPESVPHRPLATAVRTADVVAAALDSHAKNVLVIVNTCHAGNMAPDMNALLKEIRPARRESANLDVLVTCGLTTKIEVLRFPTLLSAALERLRQTAGITTSHLSIPEFMAQYARGLSPEDEKKFKLHHLIQGGTYQPSPCVPNPGYVQVPAEDWLDRATGRPTEGDTGWYFRGRESLNREVAQFLNADSQGGVLLLTGCAGSGKSAVIARAVTLSDPRFRLVPLYKAAEEASPEGTIPEEGAVHAAVLTRNRDAEQVVTAVLQALGIRPAPVSATEDPVSARTQQLLTFVRGAGSRPVTIVLDALDEAQEHARIISDVLEPLVPFCQPGSRPAVRLLIGVRSSQPLSPSTAGSAEDGGLLQVLRRVFPAARTERTDSLLSKDDLRLYLRALVGETRTAEALEEELPGIVDAVWPSFIDARLAGHQLRNAPDPAALARNSEWQRATLTQGIRGLLRRDLRMVEEDGLPSHVALALLRASAYAKGQGVPWGEVWPAIAGVFLLPEQLQPDEWDQMIGRLLGGRLSGYLAQAVEDQRRVYRPAHEELAAELLGPAGDLLNSGEGND